MSTDPLPLAPELAHHLAAGLGAIVDGREPKEFASGHLFGRSAIPLADLEQTSLPQALLMLAAKPWHRL